MLGRHEARLDHAQRRQISDPLYVLLRGAASAVRDGQLVRNVNKSFGVPLSGWTMAFSQLKPLQTQARIWRWPREPYPCE